MRPDGIMSTINCNDTIGNRTRDLSVCSAVPQPTAPNAFKVQICHVAGNRWLRFSVAKILQNRQAYTLRYHKCATVKAKNRGWSSHNKVTSTNFPVNVDLSAVGHPSLVRSCNKSWTRNQSVRCNACCQP